jgi:hypothetical protein
LVHRSGENNGLTPLARNAVTAWQLDVYCGVRTFDRCAASRKANAGKAFVASGRAPQLYGLGSLSDLSREIRQKSAQTRKNRRLLIKEVRTPLFIAISPGYSGKNNVTVVDQVIAR